MNRILENEPKTIHELPISSNATQQLKKGQNTGKTFESDGFSVQIPEDWNIDVMGPFQDSLGRTHSNSHLLTYNYDNSLNVAIYRYGFNINVEEKITSIMNGLEEDENIYDLKKVENDNSSYGGMKCKNITITYRYTDIESMYINTIYLYDDAKNSFVINIDYAEEDQPRIREALELMNQTFTVKPFE